MTAVRLSLIGAGYWGRILMRSLGEVDDAVLAAIATSKVADMAAAAPAGCRLVSDWREMVAAGGLDGVLIATPPALHEEMACRALEVGLAVFVEKPLAGSVSAAEEIARCAEACGGIAHVDHTDLFNPAWSALRAHLNEIGRLLRVETRMGGPGPIRPDVSPLWDWGPHPVAACLDLLGVPTAVRKLEAYKNQTAKGTRQMVTFALDFATGATAQVVTGNDLPAPERSVTVTGENGGLRYDDKAAEKLVRLGGPEAVSLPVPPGKPVTLALTRFAQAVRRGAPDWSDARLGTEVVRVLAALDD